MQCFHTQNQKKTSKIYDFDKTYKELANQKTSMRESGCVSLDLAYVGTGRLDGLWAFDVNDIDFVSGALIAQEGGALLSNFNGDPKHSLFNIKSLQVYIEICETLL